MRKFHYLAPQLPRENVAFSPKASPPLPSAFRSPASSLRWTKEDKAPPDRCAVFFPPRSRPLQILALKEPGGVGERQVISGGNSTPRKARARPWRAPRGAPRGRAEWLDYVSNSPPCAHHHLLISCYWKVRCLGQSQGWPRGAPSLLSTPG